MVTVLLVIELPGEHQHTNRRDLRYNLCIVTSQAVCLRKNKLAACSEPWKNLQVMFKLVNCFFCTHTNNDLYDGLVRYSDGPVPIDS